MPSPTAAVRYNAVINCWATSRQQGGAERAKSALREMQDRRASRYDLEPNDVTHTLVINGREKERNTEDRWTNGLAFQKTKLLKEQLPSLNVLQLPHR